MTGDVPFELPGEGAQQLEDLGGRVLSFVWPEAQLNIIKDAGHAASEPGIIDALVRATDKFARR